MKTLIFLTIGALLLSSLDVAFSNEYHEQDHIVPFIFEDEIEAALIAFLAPYENTSIPSLPPIVVRPENDDRIDLSLTLSDILITGISDLTVDSLDLNPIMRNAFFDMTLNGIKINIGHYIAAGHILTLPFNGDSYMRVGIEGFRFTMNLPYSVTLEKICFSYGTSVYGLGIRKPEVYFDSLNPGTDLGQSLNVIITGMAYDLTDYIEFLLNGHTFLNIDTIFIDILNSVLCPDDPVYM